MHKSTESHINAKRCGFWCEILDFGMYHHLKAAHLNWQLCLRIFFMCFWGDLQWRFEPRNITKHSPQTLIFHMWEYTERYTHTHTRTCMIACVSSRAPCLSYIYIYVWYGTYGDEMLCGTGKRLYNLTANPEKYPTHFDIIYICM